MSYYTPNRCGDAVLGLFTSSFPVDYLHVAGLSSIARDQAGVRLPLDSR